MPGDEQQPDPAASGARFLRRDASAHPGHHDVGNNEVDLRAAADIKASAASPLSASKHRVPVRAQQPREEASHSRLIIDDQHSFGALCGGLQRSLRDSGRGASLLTGGR